MKNENLEIIDVTMDISIAEEIKKKVDSLSTELTEHTKKVIKKRMKVQKVNRRKLQQDAIDNKTRKVLKFMEKAYERADLWLEGKHLCQVAELEDTSQNLNKLSMQLRKLLAKEDKWTISRQRKSRKTLYRLTKFS